MFHFKYENEFETSESVNEADEQRDRFVMSCIWCALLVLFGAIWISVIVRNVNELIFKQNANSITAEYTPGSDNVVIHRDDGSKYIIDISGCIAAANGNEITLYYHGNDIKNARPLTWTGFWVFMNICWGTLCLICMYCFARYFYGYIHNRDGKPVYVYEHL